MSYTDDSTLLFTILWREVSTNVISHNIVAQWMSHYSRLNRLTITSISQCRVCWVGYSGNNAVARIMEINKLFCVWNKRFRLVLQFVRDDYDQPTNHGTSGIDRRRLFQCRKSVGLDSTASHLFFNRCVKSDADVRLTRQEILNIKVRLRQRNLLET